MRDSREIKFFDDSPEEGDPHCLCSYCGERIEESDAKKSICVENLGVTEDEDEGCAIRCWSKNGKREARFHVSCFRSVLERGLLELK